MSSLQDLWVARPAPDGTRCTDRRNLTATYAGVIACVLPAGHQGAHLAPYDFGRMTWPNDDGDGRVRDIPHPARPAPFPLTDALSAQAARMHAWLALDLGQITAYEARDLLDAASAIAALERAADELNERVRTCHERVRCPRCRQPAGQRCLHATHLTPLKHSHEERIRADGIPLR